MKGSDYLLCHGMEMEYGILVNNDINIPEMNIEILDTLHMFRKLAENTDLNAYRLKDIVRTCDMDPTNLHNAGNDAAYTMLTFLRMNKEPEIIKEKIKDLSVVYKEKEKEKIKTKRLGLV
jgi:DNA polymerase III alpha subunit (gram-positive type)